MRKIKLSQGRYALIDDADYELVSKYKWHYLKIGYAASKSSVGIYMHRLIQNPPKGMVVDHINGDTLDNRRANLRALSIRDNVNHRVRLNSNNTSGHRGISWHAGKWEARLMENRKNIYLGRFPSKEAAIAARDNYAKAA
jgi:hypothetical protein